MAALALVVGYGIVHFFIDGIFQQLFTDLIMWIFSNMGMDEKAADQLYGRIFMDHKELLLGIGFIILFLIFYNMQVKRLLHYLVSVEMAIDSVQEDNGEPVKLVSELQPISDKLTALKRTLKEKEYVSIQSEKRKNDLVVYLAHDLKTPLTSIIAYLTMLDGQRSMTDEERKKYTHIALEKATRLGELINEFFEITRFNLQDMVLEKEKLNLTVMLEQLADESYGVLAAKYLTCWVDADENLIMNGDPDKLARVFDNLLRNAIAYSYRDTQIQIVARQKGSQAVITFTNQGHQIPEQKLKAIFEKFYRVDNARSSQTGGAGLGLSIAKTIVELHGGTIEAFSDRSHTSFKVMLPLLQQQPVIKLERNRARNARGSAAGRESSRSRARRDRI